MEHSIKLAETQNEREAIYKLRYDVFIEELDKSYLKADHEKKQMYDEADEKALLYYISGEKEETIATVRVMGGINPVFPEYAFELFKIKDFEKHFEEGELAIADRIIVASTYRNVKIAAKLHQVSYLKGMEWQTKLCFCSCDTAVLPMYLQYGWRCFTEPVELPNGKKRYPLLLILNDREYLQRFNSPYLQLFPEGIDDKGECIKRLERDMGLSLYDPFSFKNYNK